MQQTRPLPITRDLVLLGGGHAHALVLKQWAMAPLPGAQVTLVNPHPKAPYTGMLPGFVAGHYDRSELDIDLVRLARQAGARLIVDHAIGIDTTQKRVELHGRPAIAYDTLSIDIGITSALGDLPGAESHLVPAKPLGIFADRWATLVSKASETGQAPSIAILGGGVAGVELSLAMAHRLSELGLRGDIRLIEAGPSILREAGRTARAKLLAELERTQIEIMTNAKVTEVNQDGVRLHASEQRVPADFIVSAAGAAPHAWLAETALELESGYIRVDRNLCSTNTPNVFAAGDCAHLVHAPRPKAGVFAVRQAPVLYENLRASLSDGPRRSFSPQNSYLKLISLGRKSALTDKWGIGISGSSIWRLKDRIDRAFMDKFHVPMGMQTAPLPEARASGLDALYDDHTQQCGGCGAKVGHAELVNGLNSVAGAQPEDAAILQDSDRTRVLSTDHLRAFTPDAYLLAKIAAVHALGDVWAMGATPRTVLSHIILPPLAPEKQVAMIREITAGANEVFSECGTEIAGGHTSSGAELTIGFSIEGEIGRAPITQTGAKVGDLLVLTKPVGTGVLLAGEMRQLADGDHYQSALASMGRLQSVAAGLLLDHATALTDVTGFGLAGHLLNILEGSDVSARLDLERVPLLDGALALAEGGVRSTLWPSNAVRTAQMTVTASPLSDLLFDPQTCGGLLATIPATHAADLFATFKAAREPIWQIGEITAGAPHILVQ
nr:selenide, water dikinase SelD [Hyphomonas sp. Mor2]